MTYMFLVARRRATADVPRQPLRAGPSKVRRVRWPR
jgi:hypothetical protein